MSFRELVSVCQMKELCVKYNCSTLIHTVSMLAAWLSRHGAFRETMDRLLNRLLRVYHVVYTSYYTSYYFNVLPRSL